MAVSDKLDALLNNDRLASEDWNSLAKILKIKKISIHKECKRFNKEIRHAYGHTAVNIFRKWYEPDYIDILRGTAKKLKVPVKKHNTEEEIEDKIITEVLEITKNRIIKEKGQAAWDEIERQVEEEILKMIKEGKLSQSAVQELKKHKGVALMGLLLAGKLSGFAIYILANQIFFAVARQLGLKIGVAVAGPIIGQTLAFLLGPAGWIIAGLWLAYDIGNTNWRKVIPAVIFVAMMRKKIDAESTNMIKT